MKTVFFSLLFVIFFSCSTDPPTSSQFHGTWSGTYGGTTGENGTWIVSINSNGIVTGTATSLVFSQTYMINGTVSSNGTFYATSGSSSSGATFNGTLINTVGTGTWINNITPTTYSGTWSGNKH